MFDTFDLLLPRLLPVPRLRLVKRASGEEAKTYVFVGDIELGTMMLARDAFSAVDAWTGAAGRDDWTVIIVRDRANAAAQHDGSWKAPLEAVATVLEAHSTWRLTCESDCDQHPRKRMELTPGALVELLDGYRARRHFPIAFDAEAVGLSQPAAPMREPSTPLADSIAAFEARLAAMEGSHPGLLRLPLLAISKAALLEVAARHDLLAFTLDEDAPAFLQALQADASIEARLAEVFADLHMCSNFPQELWRSILAQDPTRAAFACEHAFFVAFVSGADEREGVAKLVCEARARDVVAARAAALEGLGLDSAARYLTSTCEQDGAETTAPRR